MHDSPAVVSFYFFYEYLFMFSKKIAVRGKSNKGLKLCPFIISFILGGGVSFERSRKDYGFYERTSL